MTTSMNSKMAIQMINKNGVLIVFPIQNRKEPLSLWALFFPRTKMIWAWDEESDNRVGSVWRLMKKLSESHQVVYTKWYQGRATFFSRNLFTALLRIYHDPSSRNELSIPAQNILACLENDSPVSTKQLKRLSGLQGRIHETIYNKAIKELFNKFLAVVYGEVDDGAFPSLALGATTLLYEDLFLRSKDMTLGQAYEILNQYMPDGGLFRKYLNRSFISKKSKL